jgi:hypothetical protein
MPPCRSFRRVQFPDPVTSAATTDCKCRQRLNVTTKTIIPFLERACLPRGNSFCPFHYYRMIRERRTGTTVSFTTACLMFVPLRSSRLRPVWGPTGNLALLRNRHKGHIWCLTTFNNYQYVVAPIIWWISFCQTDNLKIHHRTNSLDIPNPDDKSNDSPTSSARYCTIGRILQNSVWHHLLASTTVYQKEEGFNQIPCKLLPIGSRIFDNQGTFAYLVEQRYRYHLPKSTP